MTTKIIIPLPEPTAEERASHVLAAYSKRCDAVLAAAGAGAEFENDSEDVTDQHEGETIVFYVP